MDEGVTVSEYVVDLDVKTRCDGSVFVSCSQFPYFSVVGRTEAEAADLVKSILPDYLRANVPDFVELVPARSATMMFSKEADHLIPAHMIARTGEARERRATPPSSRR